MSATARRLAWLGAWMMLAALTWAMGSVARASEYIRYESATSSLIDGDSHHYWNQRSGDQERVVSSNGYQYSAYWDSDDRLDVTRRDLSTNAVQVIEFSEYVLSYTNDPLRTISLGISPDGRLHVAFDNHVTGLKWIRSDANFTTSPPRTIATSQFRRVAAPGFPALISTDVHFFNDRVDDLYVTYRYGSYDRGSVQLAAYDSVSGRWIEGGTVIEGLIGCQVNWWGNRICERGVSDAGFRFDRNDRLHAMWVWNDTIGGRQVGMTNHDVNYAYSDDYGATWRNNVGTLIATPSREDWITVEDATVVASVDENYGLLEVEMTLDTHNQPHAAVLQSSAPSGGINYMNMQVLHYWRDKSGNWFSQYLTDTSVEWTHNERQGLGTIFLDGGDNLYYIHAVDRLGWHSQESDEWEIRNFGWRPGNESGSGIVVGTKDAEHAEITTGYVRLAISATTQVTVRMRNDSNARFATMYYITAEDETFDEGKSVTFEIRPNSSWTTYRVPMGTTTDWFGTLRQLVFDPIGTPTSNRGGFSIDSIRVTDTFESDLPKVWDFEEGWKLEAVESSPGFNYESVTRHDLSTGATQAVHDQGYPVDMRRLQEQRIVSIPSVEQSPSTGLIEYATREFRIGSTAVVKAWEFPSDEQEWQGGNVSGWDASEGAITATMRARAELWTSEDLGVPIDQTTNRYITMRLRNATTATQSTFWFKTDADPTWTVAKSKTFTMRASSGYNTYTIDMNGVRGWTGTLRTLDLTPAIEASSGSFGIDWIRVGP